MYTLCTPYVSSKGEAHGRLNNRHKAARVSTGTQRLILSGDRCRSKPQLWAQSVLLECRLLASASSPLNQKRRGEGASRKPITEYNSTRLYASIRPPQADIKNYTSCKVMILTYFLPVIFPFIVMIWSSPGI